MEGNSSNVDNAKNVEVKVNKPKKKHGIKIAVVLVIVIMALIIGVLTWMLVSGKDFSTIFNKNNEEQTDSKGQNVVSADNNNGGNGMAIGKGGDNEILSNTTNNNNNTNTNNDDLKDSFTVRYDTRGVRNITIEGTSFVCNEDVPEISGISSSAKAKIEKEIADRYSKVWEDIKAQTSDEYVTELLPNMNKNATEYGPEDIGFH